MESFGGQAWGVCTGDDFKLAVQQHPIRRCALRLQVTTSLGKDLINKLWRDERTRKTI